MYFISKSVEISACHHLLNTNSSKCSRPHGHNYHIDICCKAETLDENGMVVDFTLIKALVVDVLDHMDLNEVLPCNPTSENLAKWICDRIPNCYKVSVQETSDNVATYIKD